MDINERVPLRLGLQGRFALDRYWLDDVLTYLNQKVILRLGPDVSELARERDKYLDNLEGTGKMKSS